MRNLKAFETFSREGGLPGGSFSFADLAYATGMTELPFWAFCRLVDASYVVSVDEGPMDGFGQRITENGVMLDAYGYGYWFERKGNETVPVDPKTGGLSPISGPGEDRISLLFDAEFNDVKDFLGVFDDRIDWLPNGPVRNELARSQKSKRLFGI